MEHAGEVVNSLVQMQFRVQGNIKIEQGPFHEDVNVL